MFTQQAHASMPSPVKAIVVGAGSRGKAYSDYASIYPDRLRVSLFFNTTSYFSGY